MPSPTSISAKRQSASVGGSSPRATRDTARWFTAAIPSRPASIASLPTSSAPYEVPTTALHDPRYGIASTVPTATSTPTQPAKRRPGARQHGLRLDGARTREPEEHEMRDTAEPRVGRGAVQRVERVERRAFAEPAGGVAREGAADRDHRGAGCDGPAARARSRGSRASRAPATAHAMLAATSTAVGAEERGFEDRRRPSPASCPAPRRS